MKNGIRPPRGKNGTWSFRIDCGQQPAQRCGNPACPWLLTHKGSFLRWTNGRRLSACPHCAGQLHATTARRLVDWSGYATKRDAVIARDVERARYRDLGEVRVPRARHAPPLRTVVVERQVSGAAKLPAKVKLPAKAKPMGVIYAVLTAPGRVKLGFTTDLPKRLNTILGDAGQADLLYTAPGTKADESALHAACYEHHIVREFFRPEGLVAEFAAGKVDLTDLPSIEKGEPA